MERINALQQRIESLESAVASDSRSALWWAAAHIADPSTSALQRAQLSSIFEVVLAQLTEFRGFVNDWIASPDDLTQWSHE